MKEMLKITASLTGVCIAAALILGAVYTQTEHPRKLIEKHQHEEIIQGLLGFGGGKKAPEDFAIHPVHRYVVNDPEKGTLLAYVLPAKEDKAVVCEIDLAGKPVVTVPLKAGGAELAEEGPRTKAVKDVLPKGSDATYAETFYVANKGSKRHGFVIPGITQGFKTFVKLMVSVDPDYTLTGVEITESEEDPGLGALIEEDYFRNQFVGKTVEALPKLEVVKKPLPEEYKTALEPSKPAYKKLGSEKVDEILKKHLKDDIYALTGATISSRAVTRGVKNTVKKFHYRFDILTKAIKEQNIPVAF